MKALFISNDSSIFIEDSESRKRMRAYAAAIGTLHILSRALTAREIQEGGLFLHGISRGAFAAQNLLTARARALIESEGIEVVSAQDPFEYGRIAQRAVKGTNAKLHIQIHTDFLSPGFMQSGSSMSFKNFIRRRLADRILPKADGIRVVSERVRQSVVARYGNHIPIPTVIPIAVESELPAKVELPPHSFAFVLMTVGRLEPEKRIDKIIEALASISDRYPAVGLMIVGEGRERIQLEKLVADRNLHERVVFTGARTDAWGLMRSATAYIQASAYEGYSRTLIEAAVARIPIITTDVGVVGEIFAKDEDVLVAIPSNSTQLAGCITRLLEDNAVREILARNAELKARAHLSAYADLPHAIASDLLRLTSGSRET